MFLISKWSLCKNIFTSLDYQHHAKNSSVTKLKLASKRIVIPWSLKLYIGVEDVFAKLETFLENTTNQEAASKHLISTRSPFHFPNETTSDCLSFIMQVSCVHASTGKLANANITLQAFTLLKKNNGQITKLASGETFEIGYPWMYTNTPNVHKCLPDSVELELWLIQEKLSVSALSYKKTTQSTIINHVPPNNSHTKLFGDVFGIKFKFNYLIF